MTYDITAGLTLAKIYSFKIRAVNAKGNSEFSDIVSAAVGRISDTPSAPTLNKVTSNRTHTVIQWVEGTSTDIPVLGYRLYSDNKGNEEYELIFDGTGQPNILDYTHGPLSTGDQYNYKLEVLNYNGPSAKSASLKVQVCEKPQGFESLEVISTSKILIKLSWKSPLDNGGCIISGYTL